MAQIKRKFRLVGEPDEPEVQQPVPPDADGTRSWVAKTLRQSRQRAGYSLRDVATILRIRFLHLEAIEDGRFGDLPGSVYAIGFVRTYADFLQLDAEEVVRRFKEEVAGVNRATELVFPAPAPEGRVPGGAILVIGILMAALAYGGWYYLSATDRTIADLMPSFPDRFATLIDDGIAPADLPAATTSTSAATSEGSVEATVTPAPAEPATAPGTAAPLPPPTLADEGPALRPIAPARPVLPRAGEEAPPLPDGAADGEAATADPMAALAHTPAEERPGAPAAAAPAAPSPAAAEVASLPPPPPAEVTPPAPPAPAAGRILVRALADSWVQVRDSQGNLLMTRVLKPGDTYEVPDTTGLRLVTGNAGGLEIVVDGEVVPSLGRVGDVVRNVALDAERLKAGTAVRR
jgi:cytoskeletal protein RodZ